MNSRWFIGAHLASFLPSESAISSRRLRRYGWGRLRAFSHWFTVLKETPTSRANCSWVRRMRRRNRFTNAGTRSFFMQTSRNLATRNAIVRAITLPVNRSPRGPEASVVARGLRQSSLGSAAPVWHPLSVGTFNESAISGRGLADGFDRLGQGFPVGHRTVGLVGLASRADGGVEVDEFL